MTPSALNSESGGRQFITWRPWQLLKACYRARIVTVEIAAIFFIAGIYNPLYEQYYYHYYGSQILRNTSFEFPNGSFCVNSEMINNYTGSNDSYKHDQSLSNHLEAATQVAKAVPSVVATLLIGPVMDRYGRKIGIIIPAIGTTLQGIISFFIIRYNLNPYFFILVTFIGGMFGNLSCFLAASFAYVADVSSPRWRSLRIAIVEACIAFGSVSGNLFLGFWLNRIACNFVPPLWFFIACNFAAVLYTIIFVPESLDSSERKALRLAKPFNLKTYLESFKLYCGTLPTSSTWQLYVATIITVVAVLNINGGSLIDIYFVKSLPFNFNPFEVGIYLATRLASQGLAGIFVMGLLVSLKVNDRWILLIATAFHCICNVLIGFSRKAWQLFAIASVKGVEGIAWGASRGLMSKLVTAEQQGTLFAIVASIEAIGNLIASFFWPLVYPATLEHHMRSGTTYFFIAAVGCTLIPLILSLFFFKKKAPSRTTANNPINSIETSNDSDNLDDEGEKLLLDDP